MRLVALATLSASAAYLAMNLLMVQSSLVLKDLCTFSESSRAIQAHVVAMFVPSFFTGVLIDKLGVRRLIATGFLMVASAAVLGLMPSRYETTVAALILLGVGWNFAYVGGGVLLTQATAHADRHRWQGINDSVIAASATLGALLRAGADPGPCAGCTGEKRFIPDCIDKCASLIATHPRTRTSEARPPLRSG